MKNKLVFEVMKASLNPEQDTEELTIKLKSIEGVEQVHFHAFNPIGLLLFNILQIVVSLSPDILAICLVVRSDSFSLKSSWFTASFIVNIFNCLLSLASLSKNRHQSHR